MLSRRELLRSAPLVAVAAGLSEPRFARAGADGLIVRVREPRNLETPLSDLTAAVTPTDRFYVRDHFAMPEVDPKAFKLTVEGHVENKLELTLADLKKLGESSAEVVLECAGNGRVFLTPAARGAQWAHGAVGLAKWTGTPLGAVLERAKVKAGAGDVVLIGADSGAIADPATPGTIHFDRGIPLAKAKKDETLLAWGMNDDPLPPAHGGPLRAVVGGWYGMASVKWLSRIVVLDRPHAGYWQTIDYTVWDRTGGLPQLTPITAIQPKAVVTSLGVSDAVPVGKEIVVSGRAWAGESAVAKVEFSADGGKTWGAAKLGASKPLGWAGWSAAWTPATKGTAKVVARCTDTAGRTQPDKRDPDRRTYMINHLVPVEIVVK